MSLFRRSLRHLSSAFLLVCPLSDHSRFVMMWPLGFDLRDRSSVFLSPYISCHITRLLSWCGLRQANFWMWLPSNQSVFVLGYFRQISLDVIFWIRPTSHKWRLVLMGNSLFQLCSTTMFITRLSSWSDLLDVNSVICVVFLSGCSCPVMFCLCDLLDWTFVTSVVFVLMWPLLYCVSCLISLAFRPDVTFWMWPSS